MEVLPAGGLTLTLPSPVEGEGEPARPSRPARALGGEILPSSFENDSEGFRMTPGLGSSRIAPTMVLAFSFGNITLSFILTPEGCKKGAEAITVRRKLRSFLAPPADDCPVRGVSSRVT